MATYTGRSTIFDYISNESIPDGDHTLDVNGVSIDIEMYNFESSIDYSASPVLGNSTPDQRMLILNYKSSLTIGTGVVLRPQVRKKGMTVFVAGTLTNNGTISMTARGAVAAGQNLYLFRRNDGGYEYIPASGGTGATYAQASGVASTTVTAAGIKGVDGVSRGTGGGGSGGVSSWRNGNGAITRSGAGATGTSYSGGSGGGGINAHMNNATQYNGNSAAGNGGAGGNGISYQWDGTTYVYTGGGAGNPGGNGTQAVSTGTANTYNAAYNGGAGTGGLLILFSNVFVNNGVIESKGSNGGAASNGGGGGSSGGGSINIFFSSKYSSTGTVSAAGGSVINNGGAGGAGSITYFDTTKSRVVEYVGNLEVVEKISDLQVGKMIRCHYDAPSGIMGAFSNLGKTTSALIPAASTTTPNGDFYFVMVDGYNGKKILVADRNIQSGISWNTLNDAGVGSGSGVKLGSQVPQMTSYTAPSGVVSSSGELNGYWQAWNAFNKGVDADTYDGWIASTKNTGWIQYRFPSARRINRYAIKNITGVNWARFPTEWTLQASETGTFTGEQVTIDSQTGIYFTDGERKFFDINPSNIGIYTYYRVVVTAANGGNEVGIAEIEYFDDIDGQFRLLTGGISATDKDNEWDKYVVNSNLGGTLPVGSEGSNAVWNWSGMWSSTSTTPTGFQVNKTMRGNGSVAAWSSISVSLMNGNANFRPVLIVAGTTEAPIVLRDRYFVVSEAGDIYTYGESGWVLVGDGDITREIFELGMSSVSVLDNTIIQALPISTFRLALAREKTPPVS